MYSVVRILVIVALVASFIDATHFRYGTVSFTKNPANPRAVTFKFDLAMRRSFFGAPNTGSTLYPGTVVVTGITQTSLGFVVTNADISNDIVYCTGTSTVTLNAGSTYAYFTSNARISNLNNNADGDFNFGATVVLTASEIARTTPINNSPVSGLLPVLSVPLNSVPFYYDITASDPENEILSYRLSTFNEMRGTNPPGLSTSNAGRVTLAQALRGGFWSTQQVISDTYGQNVAVDYLLSVVPVVSYCNGPCGNTASCNTNAGCVSCGACVPAVPAIVTAGLGSSTYPQTNLPAPQDGDIIFVQTGQTITVSFVAYDPNFPFGSRIVMYTSGVSNFVTVSPQRTCNSANGCTFVGNYSNPQFLQVTATPPLSANGTQSTICVGVTSNGNALPYSQHCITLAISAPVVPRSVCGNGVIEVTEQCDGGACCASNCQFATSATTCRASAGPCDVAETCTGSDATCPADVVVPATTTCRASAGPCDVAETCDGSSVSCPADSFAASTVTCRASAGDCDVAETCSGSDASCPADSVSSATTVCRASAGPCDVAETCDGLTSACPADTVLPSTTTCRASAGPCDVAETCDGSATSCPADAVAASTVTCRVSAGDCDVAETCDGSSVVCPADAVVAFNTVCRASAGVCDIDEVCDGSSAACPINNFVASTTTCRASAGDCDVAETCTGSDAACPVDAFLPSTTVCRAKNGVCDAEETCTGSSSTCPPNAAAPSTTVCRPKNTTQSCDVEEKCDGVSFKCPIDQVSNSSYCQTAALVCPRVSNTTSGSSEWYCNSATPTKYFQCYTQYVWGSPVPTYTNMPCPSGTQCNCGYGQECSCNGRTSPCTSNGLPPTCSI